MEDRWNLLKDWAMKSNRLNEILPTNSDNAKNALLKLQVSTKTMLGTVIYNTGGIFIDNKWLRILGSKNEMFKRNIISWNRLNDSMGIRRLKGGLLIADDIIGGFFAINEGGLPGNIGNIFYFSPDTLEWEDLGIDYWAFIKWALLGDIEIFYKSFRWADWEKKSESVSCEKGILIYPFLWADGPKIIDRVRKIVTIEEIWNINIV